MEMSQSSSTQPLFLSRQPVSVSSTFPPTPRYDSPCSPSSLLDRPDGEDDEVAPPPPYNSTSITSSTPTTTTATPPYSSKSLSATTTHSSSKVTSLSDIKTPSDGSFFCPAALLERQANSLPGGGMSSAGYFAPCATCGYTLTSTVIPAVYKRGWIDWVDPSVNYRWESHCPPSDSPSATPSPAMTTSLASMSDDSTRGQASTPSKATTTTTTMTSWLFRSFPASASSPPSSPAREGRGREGEERLSCLICHEYDDRSVSPMSLEEWYVHQRRHFFVEGYRICRGKKGGMQRRRNCERAMTAVGGMAGSGCPKVHS